MLQIQETNGANGHFSLEKYDGSLSYPRLFSAHQKGFYFFACNAYLLKKKEEYL